MWNKLYLVPGSLVRGLVNTQGPGTGLVCSKGYQAKDYLWPILGSSISLRMALGCYCEQTWATCHIESHASAVQMTELFEVDPVKDYTLTTELSDNRDFRPVASWEHAER